MQGSTETAGASTQGASEATTAGRSRNDWLFIGVLAAAWLGFGMVAGSVEYWTAMRGQGRTWLESVWSPVLAGAVWIGISAAAVAAVRRWPVWPPRVGRLLFHLGLSVAASFVLNLSWAAGAAALTAVGFASASVSASAIPAVTWSSGLRYLHFNAGTWWVLTALVTLWDRERGAAVGHPGVARPDASAPPTPASGAPARDAPAHEPASQVWAETLAVRVGTRTRVIPVEDIDWIEGAGDYACLHVAGSAHLSAERLKDLEARLDPARFARVHRSSIVNLSRVRELKHRSHGDYEAVLRDGTVVRVSRSRRESIERLLGRR